MCKKYILYAHSNTYKDIPTEKKIMLQIYIYTHLLKVHQLLKVNTYLSFKTQLEVKGEEA